MTYLQRPTPTETNIVKYVSLRSTNIYVSLDTGKVYMESMNDLPLQLFILRVAIFFLFLQTWQVYFLVGPYLFGNLLSVFHEICFLYDDEDKAFLYTRHGTDHPRNCVSTLVSSILSSTVETVPPMGLNCFQGRWIFLFALVCAPSDISCVTRNPIYTLRSWSRAQITCTGALYVDVRTRSKARFFLASKPYAQFERACSQGLSGGWHLDDFLGRDHLHGLILF